MAFFSLEHTTQQRHSALASTIIGAVAAWKRYRAERVLEGLSYDTLKDIGFPSAERVNDTTAAR